MSDRGASVTPGAELSVLVVGMHRSGTSAIAEALSAAGLEIGPDDALMPPRLENPSFFGERLDVAGLDDRLLAALDWTWDAPAATILATPPPLDEIVADSRRLVSSLLAGGMRLFKDPRMSVLLPWWRRILLDRFVAVLPVRSPEEVAWSLSVRDGLPFELGLALWMTYHRHLAAGLDGLPVVIVDYDALTTDPAPVVTTLIDELVRFGVADRLDTSAAAAAIHPSLRRTTQPTAADDALVDAARASAKTWAGDRVRTFDRFAMPTAAPSGWEVALLDLQRKHRRAALEAIDARRSRDQLATELEAARSEVAAALEAKVAAERDVAVANEEAASSRSEVETLRLEVTRLGTEAQAVAAAARAEAQAALDDAAVAREEARVARDAAERTGVDATAAWRRAEAASRDAATASRDAATAHKDAAAARGAATVALSAHNTHSRTIGRIPGVGGIRHAARQVSDTLADLPVTSALQRNPLFDADWYLERYPDVRRAGLDPWRHYRRHGVAEGRDPNPWFGTTRYLDENPDVRASGINPLDHYLRHGAAEGRGPAAPSRAAGQHHPRPGEHDGGGSDPPPPSGLEGRPDAASRPSRAGSRRAWPRVSRWLEAQVPSRVARGSTVIIVGGGPATRMDQLTLVPIDGPEGSQPSDTALMARLEWQRSQGASVIALPASSQELLDDAPRFARLLERRYPVIVADAEVGVIRDLRTACADPRPTDLSALIEELRAGPSVGVSLLDRSASGAAAGVAGVQLVESDPAVPWPPRSVDVVLLDAGADDAQARRVATRAVITLPSAPDEPPQLLRLDETAIGGLRISIVIPHHGPLEVLRTCLTSLRETTGDAVGLEILVIDDATPGIDHASLEACVGEMPGARLLVNDANLGFLASANRGAAAAAGDILVFLNNDTLLLPGWLPPLVATFQEHPDAGVVGGRLVYPDGRLQEAGGLVFRDGSAAKFGYGDLDPDKPMYMFLRETDYVSGALLATPRALFEELDGLDQVFGFGFYEDTDYCFRVRQTGRTVLYQPASTIIHVEGATAGTDPTVGPKRSQVENEVLFRERWAGALSARPDRPRTVRPEDWYAAAMSPRAVEAVAR